MHRPQTAYTSLRACTWLVHTCLLLGMLVQALLFCNRLVVCHPTVHSPIPDMQASHYGIKLAQMAGLPSDLVNDAGRCVCAPMHVPMYTLTLAG